MIDRAGLEIRYTPFGYRGFESLTFRKQRGCVTHILLNMAWPQMSDQNDWGNSVAKLFNITSIPHTIVVDQQGKILRHGLRGEALANFVAEQLQ